MASDCLTTLNSNNEAAQQVLVEHPSKQHAYDQCVDQLEQPFKDLVHAKLHTSAVVRTGDIPSAKATCTRLILQQWALDVQSQNIPHGKAPPRHKLWGETLLDFFRIVYDSSKPYLHITSTTSRLAAWMRKNGEENVAPDLLEWSEHEGDPHLVEPVDVLRLINIDSEKSFVCNAPDLSRSTTEESAGASPPLLPEPFDHANYPHPWLLAPFSSELHPLQKRLPLHLLPKKLHIHDPDNVLSMKKSRTYSREIVCAPSEDAKKDDAERWKLGPDGISHTYSLKLSDTGQTKARRECKDSASSNNTCDGIEGLFFSPDASAGEIHPPLLVSFPPKPPLPDTIPEAHLYLDSKAKLGEGNHSSVFAAEYEVPFPILAEPDICHDCVVEEIGDKLHNPSAGTLSSIEYHFSWDHSNRRSYIPCRLLGSAERVSEIYAKARNTATPPADLGEKGVLIYLEKPCDRRQVILLDETGEDPRNKSEGNVCSDDEYCARIARSKLAVAFHQDTPTTLAVYAGPLRIIQSRTKWRIPGVTPACKHRREIHNGLQPTDVSSFIPTFKVRVAAKLSKPGDDHLSKEAQNYQIFPPHFFQHWSGYIADFKSLRDPVPCGAVVPQFYGHYVPDTKNRKPNAEYLSPILLIEDCGKAIEGTNLDLDDRQECASLLFRMHMAGWVHGSVYPRNFVFQDGPINASPEEKRQMKARKSFRIIDFGRSEIDDRTGDVYYEVEKAMDRVFDLGYWNLDGVKLLERVFESGQPESRGESKLNVERKKEEFDEEFPQGD